MLLREYAKKFENRKNCAKKFGISVFHLNNLICKDAEIARLKDGRYIVLRADSIISC